jgi:hypothetical protein
MACPNSSKFLPLRYGGYFHCRVGREQSGARRVARGLGLSARWDIADVYGPTFRQLIVFQVFEKGIRGGRVAVFAYRPPWRAGPGRPPDIWPGLDTPAKNAGYSTDFFNKVLNKNSPASSNDRGVIPSPLRGEKEESGEQSLA